MRYTSSAIRLTLKSVLVGTAIGVMALTGAMGCKKQDTKERVDPHAEEDEIVRIDARRQVKYPGATKEGSDAFYLVTSPNPTGASLADAQWIYIDFTTTSFDNRFIGSSVADSARLYRQHSTNTRYVPSLKKNDKNELGEALFNILQKCREGERLIVGMSAKAGNVTGMWKSQPNESVIASITLAKAVNNPEADEHKLIESFLATHAGFVKQDSVYKKINAVGQGKKIPGEGKVHCKYSVYFLDGSLIETNDESIAARHGATIPSNQAQLLTFAVKDDPSIVRGLSGICIGEPIGTKLELIVPSAQAYKDKGKGSIRPYEPLRFELTIVNHSTM